MNKKDKKALIIIAVILAIFLLTNSDYISRQFGFDDFAIEDTFDVPDYTLWTQETLSFACQSGGGGTTGHSSSASIGGGAYTLSSQGLGAIPTVTYNKNLINHDIKTSLTGSYNHNNPADYSSAGSMQFVIKLGGIVVYSGGTPPILTGSISANWLIELYKDFQNPDLFHIVVDGVETSTVTITAEEAFLSYSITGVDSSCAYPVSGSLSILELKARPYFNCEVENDEVVIKDSFVALPFECPEGQICMAIDPSPTPTDFTIQDLTYTPVKFCVESYPAIKRSFTEEGVRADIQGLITRALTRGETVTVQPDEMIEIYYIADYIEGMGERCAIDSAFDVNSGECTKIINEAADIVQLVDLTELVTVSNEQVLGTNTIQIGEQTISSIKPSYLCTSEDKKTFAPNPRPECWTTDILYNGAVVGDNIIANSNIDVGSYFNVKWIPSARVDDSDTPAPPGESQPLPVLDGWVNNLLLTIIGDILTVERTPTDDHYLIFGEPHTLDIDITSNVGSFPEGDSGVRIVKTTDLFFTQTSEMVNYYFSSEKLSIPIDIDTNFYGEVTYEVLPWYKIGGKFFFDDQKVIKSYIVVDKTPSDLILELDALNLTLAEKIARINDLELNITEKAELIAALSGSNKDFITIVANLLTSLDEKQALIDAYAALTDQDPAPLLDDLNDELDDPSIPPPTTPLNTPLIIMGALLLIYIIQRKK